MSMPKIEMTIENGIGVERVLKLPAKYEVCGRCEGKGTHVNPSIDENGISPEEFRDDPDFEEAYFSGVYDVTCYECHGRTTVLVLDWDKMNEYPKLLKRITDKMDADADYERMCEMERRMGA